jgi:phage terminase large subunit-like protein
LSTWPAGSGAHSSAKPRSNCGAQLDSAKIRGGYEIVVEQEPGSGGKESVEFTIRNPAGFRVVPDKVTGSKQVRAEPFAAQVQAGNVRLVAGDWHYAYLDELESFPAGKYRDQVDASSGAFNRLVAGPSYNLFSGAFDDCTNCIHWKRRSYIA